VKSAFSKSLVFNLIPLAIIAIGITACSDGRLHIPPNGQKSNNTSSQPSVKEVSFFVDATESMAGFASASQYQELIRSLENSVTNLPNFANKIDKRKFGSHVDKNSFKGRLIEDLTEISFYTGPDQKTQIQNVLTEQHIPYDREKLAVIITDLLQDQTDLGLVVDKIKPYLSKGLSVGLIGVNSNFDGKLFDYIPNRNEARTPYKGQRPVYALVIGEAVDISEYFDLIKNLSPILKQKGKFTIFSSQLFKHKIDFWEQNPVNLSNNLINNGRLDNTDINSFDFQDNSSPLSFSVCASKPTALSEDVAGYGESQQGGWESQFEPNVTIERYRKTKTGIFDSLSQDKPGTSANSTKLVPNSLPNANEYVKIQSSKENQKCKLPDDISFVVEISSPKSLIFDGDPTGNYLTTITLLPQKENYPQKWDEWSISNQIEQPSRTLNLSPFVKGLYKATISSELNNSERELIFYINK
jgi:hypothetical protein